MYIFLFLALFAYIAYIKLDLAILFTIIALPTYLIRFSLFNIPFTLLEAMILISFFVWFIFKTKFKEFLTKKYTVKEYFENKKNRTRYPFDIEIISVLIISFLAIIVAGFTNQAFGIWKAYYFEAILFFILILNNFQNKVRNIVYSLSISAFIVSCFAIIQKFTGIFISNEFWRNEETRRVVSFFGYPNAVGLFLAPIIIIMIGLLFSLEVKKSKKELAKKVFLIITIVFSILSIYFAKSEGALIALLASFVVFGFFANKTLKTMTIIFLILIMGAILFIPTVRGYCLNKATLMDFSGQVRRAQWDETWKMLKDGRFIQGAGLANYKNEVKSYHVEGIFYNNGTDKDFHRHTVFNEEYRKKVWRPVEIYLYPHNIILNFWVELGFFGMLIFLWIIIKLIYILYNLIIKTKSKEDYFIILGLLGAITTIIVHGLVDVPYFKNDLVILFWLFIAMTSLIKLKNLNKWK